MDTGMIIKNFLKASIEHGEGTTNGNSKLANKSYKIIEDSYKWLKENNQLMGLITLLEHEDYSVKLWAASYILNIEPIRAVDVLQEVINYGHPLLSFSAEMTLKEWEDGNLKF